MTNMQNIFCINKTSFAIVEQVQAVLDWQDLVWDLVGEGLVFSKYKNVFFDIN